MHHLVQTRLDSQHIPRGGSYYANYGRGKCVYVDGRDFGKVWDAGFKYVHKGGRRCESLPNSRSANAR